jgi:NB-ARC domain/Anaphase-promoting complex subunit 4 WD40 domain
VLLDEAWLAALLPRTQVSPVSRPAEEVIGAAPILTPLARDGSRVDWGDALAATTFYGREWELTLLTSWIVEERCRVVSVLGLGGIGKSSLATKVMRQVAARFEVVIWRSLRDAPTCEALLDACLQVLAPQALREGSLSLERRLALLLEHLRRSRVLLVLDNLEALLKEGQETGHMRAGYVGFARLLRQVAETEHQSCLLLTSREKPSDLVPLEGSRAPVRALRLARLDADSCKQLLAEKEVAGSAAEQARLIVAYAGNPLALKIVAQTIVELFAGQVAPFLEQGEVVFGGVRELLEEQYTRLADLERTLLRWLAILREPVTLTELHGMLVMPRPAAEVLEVLDSLRRRSFIERGQLQGSFTLQSVVLVYVTTQLIVEAAGEIELRRLARLIEHGLELATAKEYVRQTQQRLIVAPLLARVREALRGRADVERHLLALLDQLRTQADDAQGYGPANVLALLRERRGHLRGLNLSQLSIRGAYLHGVEMQDASLAEASLRETVLNEVFDIPWAVAISRDGRYWAAGSRRGEARVWRAEGKLLHLAWHPTGEVLVSGGSDGCLRWWDVQNGKCLALRWEQQGAVQSPRVCPFGRRLASCGDVHIIQIWDLDSGERLQTLRRDRPYERLNISGIRGLSEAQKTALRALGAVERIHFASGDKV